MKPIAQKRSIATATAGRSHQIHARKAPPANALRGFGTLKHATLLTATELDTVLTWATGGNPRGSLEQQLPKVVLHNVWALGTPDVTLTLPEVALAADRMEQTQEFLIPTGTTEARWLRERKHRPVQVHVNDVSIVCDRIDSRRPAPRVEKLRWRIHLKGSYRDV